MGELSGIRGSTAPATELAVQLAEAEAEIARLRVRMAQLSNLLAQVEVERDHYRRALDDEESLQSCMRSRARGMLRLGGKAARTAWHTIAKFAH